VEAFTSGDYIALHAALNLRPWETSPLPIEVTMLGVSWGPYPFGDEGIHGWSQAQDLRRELEARVGDAQD
jgi:hypothetical protein